MALNQKQKEAVQFLKEELDKVKIMKDRRDSGCLAPAEIKHYNREHGYRVGKVTGYYTCLRDNATEAQAAEITKELQKYVDLLGNSW